MKVKMVVTVLGLLLIIGLGLAYFRTDRSEEPVVIPDDQREEEKDLGYSLSLPDGYSREENGQFSRLYFKKTSQPGAGPTNFIYISVIPNGKKPEAGEIYNYNERDLDSLNRLEPGETVTLEAGNEVLAQYTQFERVEGAMVGGFGAKGFVNKKPWEFPEGTTEYRYVVPFTQATYLVGGYVSTGNNAEGAITPEELANFLTTLKLTPETVTTAFTSPMPEGDWLKFTDPEAGISFEYPGAWMRREESQNFPEGDLFSLWVSGQTQREQTELYDGASFTVMKPVEAPADLGAWLKQRYVEGAEAGPSDQPEQTQVSFGGLVYEKIRVCGLGCFTYYHTVQKGKLYGFVSNAEGPQAAVYKSAIDRMMSSLKY